MKKNEKKSTTVRGKLAMFIVIIMVILLGISGTGIMVERLINSARSDQYVHYGEGQVGIVRSMNAFNRVSVEMLDFLYVYMDDPTKQQESLSNCQTFYDEIAKELDIFAANLDFYGDDIDKAYADALVAKQTYEASLNKVYEYVESGQIEQARQEMSNTCNPAAEHANELFDNVVDLLDAASDATDASIEKEAQILVIIIVVVCLLGAAIALRYYVTLSKSITNPVAQLSAAAKKLAIGDVNVELHKVSNDDLGMLMDDFEEMAAAVREQSEIASRIADGDMTIQVQPRSAEDILGNALRKLVRDNDNILGNVKDSTMQVTVGADEVAAASQALAQGATEQASALEEVTASMDEIAQHTKQNAEQANEANERVNNVKSMAVSGNDQMKSLIGAMSDISDASESISKIIKTIDDISFQTNILALNAAVEAARAGVHGKGFAVVAEEVRNLAAKSASSASETAEMIEDIIHKINNGSQLAESTASSLDEIVVSIDKIVELIGAISSASNEQATSVSQVDQAINQVSEVVQTNSATSQQCAASSAELSTQAANLRSLVAHYKLTSGSISDGQSADFGGGSHFGGDDRNEQIISLDGEFGKY
ncbi:MAG: methyl-accepting chemotaxis protein [Blautia sp.]|nr:methyl-accepting chemotaxis protein [Blautia sp.]